MRKNKEKEKVKVKQVPDDHVQRQEGPSPLEQRPVHHTSQGAHLLSINLHFYNSYQHHHNYQLIIIIRSLTIIISIFMTSMIIFTKVQ